MITINNKNYCVPQCFKDKLWVLKNVVVNILTIILLAILTFGVIGLIVQPLDIALFGYIVLVSDGLILSGFMHLAVPITIIAVISGISLILWGIVNWIYTTTIKVYSGVSNNIKYMMNVPDTEFSCTILEECKVS